MLVRQKCCRKKTSTLATFLLVSLNGFSINLSRGSAYSTPNLKKYPLLRRWRQLSGVYSGLFFLVFFTNLCYTILQLYRLAKRFNLQPAYFLLLFLILRPFAAGFLIKSQQRNPFKYSSAETAENSQALILPMFSAILQLNLLANISNSIPKYLSKEEIERFFSCVKDPRDKALFGVIYLYGLRVSEATLLKLEDVDLIRKRIFIHRVKGGIAGERPLFKTAGLLLKRYLRKRAATGDGLFTGREGNLKKLRIQQLFKQYAQKAGLNHKYSIHCLRHSIAVHLLEAGEGIEFVRDHLGHRNIQNTMVYAQITDKRREEIFERVENSAKIAKV